METRRDVFQAIADPTRRQIIHLLSRRPMNLNTIAENFDITRPAISQHIKLLTECGLIVVVKQGRERVCEGQFHKLKEVMHWVEKYQSFWTAKLDALEDFLHAESENEQKSKRKNKKGKPKR